jgi:hypothetical protein
MKKLLNDGFELTLWQRGGKKLFEQSKRKVLQIFAAKNQFLLSNESLPCLPRPFETAFSSPGPRGHILLENMFVGRFTAGQNARTRQLLAEF